MSKAVCIAFVLIDCLTLSAQDWLMLRGPNGSGVSDSAGLPAEFGNKNLLWKTTVPFGRSSPIVVGDRVFVTGNEGEKLVTLCLDRKTGKIAWHREIVRARTHKVYKLNDAASPTPASDGTNVYVFFPDLGLVSYGPDGNERWRVPLGPFHNFYGMAGSPVVSGDTVILICDQQSKSFLIAVDKDKGSVRWRVERPEMNIGYATPTLYGAGRTRQAIVMGLTRVDGYSVETGERVWWVTGTGESIYGVPVVARDAVYFSGFGADRPYKPKFSDVAAKQDANRDGRLTQAEGSSGEFAEFFKDHFGFIDGDGNGYIDEKEWNFLATIGVGDFGLHAVRLGGKGDVTKSSVRWRFKKNLPQVPSPVVYKDVLYMVKNGGISTSLDPATGAVLKEGRTQAAMDNYFASPVAADDKVFLVSESGKVTVLKAGPQWEILAVNDLAEECYATPAIAAGHVFIRTGTTIASFGVRR